MSAMTTIARPYAKAAFDIAVENQSLAEWETMLVFAAEVAKNDTIAELLTGAMAPDQLAELMISVCGEQLDQYGQNLVSVMAENKRLQALPDVLTQFLMLKALHEQTIEAQVISAVELDEAQLSEISAKLEQRLARKVKLNCSVDPSLIAGVVIRAGDMVIDNSARGRLARLNDTLQS
ncbi:F0F1 ATP synthase subunit delta [Thaumasiovibrio subtropicus]|uniref:F0F1 ATP synthase subunit delta n=1 Tax=Thaumasiovibrio subtropicus TaxID=1891207 RepID=UPI000B363BE8|nr:F0F1 ATP synthase subunit delta [Thaumasiovibrio subtropicus]